MGSERVKVVGNDWGFPRTNGPQALFPCLPTPSILPGLSALTETCWEGHHLGARAGGQEERGRRKVLGAGKLLVGRH